MKSLRLTRKQYEDLEGIYGGLVVVAVRILIGIILSFYNSFLSYSYILWGFQYAYIFPGLFFALGILYFIDTLLLFQRRKSFVAMYVFTAAAFLYISASFQGFSFLVYAGLEALLIAYIFRSRRAAVNFGIKRIEIADEKPYGKKEKFLSAGSESGERSFRK